RPSRPVDGVDALERGIAPFEHDRAGVEANPPDRGRAGGGDLAEQTPALEPCHPGELDVVGRERVAREARPVDRQYPQPSAGEQHRRRRARDAGADDDRVVHRRLLLVSSSEPTAWTATCAMSSVPVRKSGSRGTELQASPCASANTVAAVRAVRPPTPIFV